MFDDLRETSVRDEFVEKYLSNENARNLISKNKSEFVKNLLNNNIKILNKSKNKDNFLFLNLKKKLLVYLKKNLIT